MRVHPSDESEQTAAAQLAAAARSQAERRTAEEFLDDRDFLLYTLIRAGEVGVAEDGASATFTRDWVDATWRSRRSVQYAQAPDDPYPGSVEEFVEYYFKGMRPRREALTRQGRLERKAAKALRDEWRQTGRMQLGERLAGILRTAGRIA
jgi:hypothetical protein